MVFRVVSLVVEFIMSHRPWASVLRSVLLFFCAAFPAVPFEERSPRYRKSHCMTARLYPLDTIQMSSLWARKITSAPFVETFSFAYPVWSQVGVQGHSHVHCARLRIKYLGDVGAFECYMRLLWVLRASTQWCGVHALQIQILCDSRAPP